jgi:hypothetical protein
LKLLQQMPMWLAGLAPLVLLLLLMQPVLMSLQVRSAKAVLRAAAYHQHRPPHRRCHLSAAPPGASLLQQPQSQPAASIPGALSVLVGAAASAEMLALAAGA